MSKTRGRKATGVTAPGDEPIIPTLSSTRVMRTPPLGTPGTVGHDRESEFENGQTPGSSAAHDREQMAAVIREMQEEIVQLKRQVSQLQAKVEAQVGNEEIYERVTEHRAEMRDWRREIEARIERETKAHAEHVDTVRKQVRDCLEHLRQRITPHDTAETERQAGSNFRSEGRRSERLEHSEPTMTHRLRNESFDPRWATNDSARLDSMIAPPARPFIVKPQMPTFEGRNTERPAKYLRELKRFVEAARLPEEEMKFIITQSLKGNAGEWWDIVSDQITTWIQFARALIDRFWSPAIQRRVRDNLNVGVHRPESGLSRVVYAMRLIGTARDLLPRPTDEEIVQMLARHYTQAVDDCVLGQNICTIDAFLALLERFDNGGTVNRQRHDDRPNYAREWYSRNQQERATQPTTTASRTFTTSPTYSTAQQKTNRDNQRSFRENPRPLTEHQKPRFENSRTWQDQRRQQDRPREGAPERIRLAHLEEEIQEDESDNHDSTIHEPIINESSTENE